MSRPLKCKSTPTTTSQRLSNPLIDDAMVNQDIDAIERKITELENELQHGLFGASREHYLGKPNEAQLWLGYLETVKMHKDMDSEVWRRMLRYD